MTVFSMCYGTSTISIGMPRRIAFRITLLLKMAVPGEHMKTNGLFKDHRIDRFERAHYFDNLVTASLFGGYGGTLGFIIST